MICPTCKTELPPVALACPACLRRDYLARLEKSEINLLPQILTGPLNLKLLHASRARIYHLGFHDGFSTDPYCGTDVRSPRVAYRAFADRPKNLCSNCASMLAEFMKKAQSIPAQ